MVELTNIFTLKNIIIYLLIINIIAFLAMFIDKKKAEKDRWRIKESTLLTLALIGGSIAKILYWNTSNNCVTDNADYCDIYKMIYKIFIHTANLHDFGLAKTW